MHLAERSYALVVLTAILLVAGTWSSNPAFTDLWRLPAALLLIGLSLEGFLAQRTIINADIDTRTRALLGREQPAAFTFTNPSNRTVTLEYAASTPTVIEPLGYTHTVVAPRGGTGRDSVALLPVRLGVQTWPAIPARVLGRFGLAWWTRTLTPNREI